jgi:hypothetical protein
MASVAAQNLVSTNSAIGVIQYRCNRCLSVEDVNLKDLLEPGFIIPCSKCSGLAIKLPVSKPIENFFGNHNKLGWLSKEGRL